MASPIPVSDDDLNNDIHYSVTTNSDEDEEPETTASIRSFDTFRRIPWKEMVVFHASNGSKEWERHPSIFEDQSPLFASMFAFAKLGGSMSASMMDPCNKIPGVRRIAGQKRHYQLKPSVSEFDFESFLWGVQPELGREIPINRLCSMLTLSTDWDFEAIRTYAIEEISKATMDPIKKIVLARRTNVPKWVREPYIALCTRLAPISAEEATTLGFVSVAAVTEAREAVLARRWRLQDSEAPYWHSSCWNTRKKAWARIMTESQFRTKGPLEALREAMENATRGPAKQTFCDNCKQSTAGWLQLASDDKVAEVILKKRLGSDPEQWITIR